MIKILLIFFFFLIPSFVLANPPKLPDEYITKCERFKSGHYEVEVKLYTQYPPRYRVACNITSTLSWLKVEKTISDYTIIEGESITKYDVYTISVLDNYKNKNDLCGNVEITEIGIIEPNGEYGDFDLTQNTWATGTPADVYTTLVCQLDVSPESICDSATNIKNDIPNTGINQYYLFGDDIPLATQDKDVFQFVPDTDSCTIYFSFPNRGNGQKLNINVIQNNSSVFNREITINSSTQCSNVNINGLQNNQIAYVELELNDPLGESQDLKYKIIEFNCIDMAETSDWSDKGRKITFKRDHNQNLKPLFVKFNNIADIICFQCESDNDINIDFYNEQFDNLEDQATLELNNEPTDTSKYKRYVLNTLEVERPTFVKLTNTADSLDEIYLKLSRVKPVILVHGIDAPPRFEGDISFFGDLLESEQRKDFRPFVCHDFVWSSQKDIIKNWVGNGQKNGTLGAFLSSKLDENSLEATLIGHSAGCLLIYYHCQNNNAKFRNSVDNILFAAPPLLGSHMADMSGLSSWEKGFSWFLKRTSYKNMDIISRGTSLNWKRGKTKFKFPGKRVNIVIGYRQYITIEEAKINALNSINKYDRRKSWDSNKDLLKKICFNANLHLDIWWDVIVDSAEGLLELGYPSIATRNSELYSENPSDSAVGTYSANVSKNANFNGATAKYTNRIHSDVQLFYEDNPVFKNAVKASLDKIDTGN